MSVEAEKLLDELVDYMRLINKMLDETPLPDDVRQPIENARDALAKQAWNFDAGVHGEIWYRLGHGDYPVEGAWRVEGEIPIDGWGADVDTRGRYST